MAQTREERIHADDGHEFAGHLVVPDSGPGAGMIVIQEIFGLTDYIKGVCTRLSDLGYVALAPALYSRIEPDLALDDDTFVRHLLRHAAPRRSAGCS